MQPGEAGRHNKTEGGQRNISSAAGLKVKVDTAVGTPRSKGYIPHDGGGSVGWVGEVKTKCSPKHPEPPPGTSTKDLLY